MIDSDADKRTTYVIGSAEYSGLGCSNCGVSYARCSQRLLEGRRRAPCCGPCSHTDTHAVIPVPAVQAPPEAAPANPWEGYGDVPHDDGERLTKEWRVTWPQCEECGCAYETHLPERLGCVSNRCKSTSLLPCRAYVGKPSAETRWVGTWTRVSWVDDLLTPRRVT